MKFAEPKQRIPSYVDALEEAGSLNWAAVDGELLCDSLTGCRIIAADTIDYPITDGLLFLIERPDGSQMVLELGSGADEEAPELGDAFYIKAAEIDKSKSQARREMIQRVQE